MDTPNRRLPWLFPIALTGLLSVGIYLWSSYQVYSLGYPLDDAWIHQTYARNLIDSGEWSFIPGIPSAGSTSPLWTFLLALGRLLHLEHRFWTYLVGAGLLVLLGWICSRWFCHRWGGRPYWGWIVGVAITLEWHLVWASVSGMETLAFGTLCVLVFLFLDQDNLKPIGLGFLIGLGVWIRPEALTLLLPAFFILITKKMINPMKGIIRLFLGLTIPILFYLLFNHLVNGTVWPNTFYAKQAEYAILSQGSAITRFAMQCFQPIVGVGILLLPGIIYGVVQHGREQHWSRLAALGWVFIDLGMYAILLPVTYQHGRYAIPTIPILLVLGIEGLASWVKLNSPFARVRLLSRLWVLASIAVLVAFIFVGSRAYSLDVAIIETEMVSTAKWIAENTEEDALIAAHDIGAIGYFGHRKLLDLAGLISPEVIPFIRDEQAIASYLDEKEADYLVTFPEWYPDLVKGQKILFITKGEFSPEAGGNNIVVYRWGY